MRLNGRARKGLPWLLLAIAVIATAAVYWPGRTGGWVFDDYPNIVDNTAIHITRGHSTLVAWINSALSSPSSFLRRPLASLPTCNVSGWDIAAILWARETRLKLNFRLADYKWISAFWLEDGM